MGLYTVFRHRQYVGMIFPAFTPIRDSLDIYYWCFFLIIYTLIIFLFFSKKKAQQMDKESRYNEPSHEIVINGEFIPGRKKFVEACDEPGILNRSSVVYVLRNVFKGKNLFFLYF